MAPPQRAVDNDTLKETSMKTTRRRLLAVASIAASAIALGAEPSFAEDYPTKPIHLIVPYAAGGGVDNIARVVAQQLGSQLKQPVLVENRPGGNANIGAEAVAKARPDGYTLLMGATFLAFNRAVMKNLSYDPVRDLTPIARAGRAPVVLVVPSSSPIKSAAELVAYLKANPDKGSYGTVGTASPVHLLFTKNTGTKPVEVPYKGGAAALPDLISGRLTYMIQTTSEVLPMVASGKLRPLAVSSGERFKALPNVPTMKEAGVPGIDWTGWWGMFAPAGTPAPIVQRLSTELQVILKLPEVTAAIEKLGIEPAPQPSAEFASFFKQSVNEHEAVAREFKLTVE
jgi:tripartite-type tricarboxylate transporter receptor subunit TctC